MTVTVLESESAGLPRYDSSSIMFGSGDGVATDASDAIDGV